MWWEYNTKIDATPVDCEYEVIWDEMENGSVIIYIYEHIKGLYGDVNKLKKETWNDSSMYYP